MNMNSTLTVGMDLGDKRTDLCIVDAQGTVKERRQIKTDRDGVRWIFDKQPRMRVVMEVGTHSPWISRLVSELGHEVIVANARRVQLISQNIQKNDATDAEILARLGRVDTQLLSPITHCQEATQRDRARIRSRAVLVAARTKLINSVRGQMKSLGYRVKGCAAERFHRVELPETVADVVSPLLKVIEQLTMKIADYDGQISEISETRYPESAQLEAVPGVGTMTAVAFITTLEDASRYKNGRAAAAFLGLTPKRRQSGGKDPELGITKTGDVYVRSLLVQCAQRILGPFGKDSALRRWGLRLCDRGGKGAKKKAIIAVARKLAAMLFHLWQSGKTYEPFPNGQPALPN